MGVAKRRRARAHTHTSGRCSLIGRGEGWVFGVRWAVGGDGDVGVVRRLRICEGFA